MDLSLPGDQHGQVIAALLSARRDLAAARRFFARTLRAGKVPVEVTADQASVYPRARDELVPSALHTFEPYANNPVEADHGRLKARVRQMRGLKRYRSARILAAAHAFVQNLRRGHYDIATDVRSHRRLRVAFRRPRAHHLNPVEQPDRAPTLFREATTQQCPQVPPPMTGSGVNDVSSSTMAGQNFQPGDHLMVRRRGYQHHGIYVDDQRVIDFGGNDLLGKRHNGVRPVTLDQFAGGRAVVAVRHPGLGRIFGPNWLPDPRPRKQIVAEAERLAQIGFAGKYTLFGSNCEHVANWCVTGNYFESLQLKRFFRAHAAASLMMILMYKSKHHTICWRATCWILIALAAIAQYQWQRAPYSFWRGIDREEVAPWE